MRFIPGARIRFLFAALLVSAGSGAAQGRSDAQLFGHIREAHRKRDYASALAMVDQLIAQSPGLTPAYVERATLLFDAGETMKAWDETVAILKRDPKATGVYPLRARIRFALCDYEGAIVEATRAGEGAEMVEIRGAARMALGRYADARKDYEFLRSGPFGPYTNARYPLAVCLMGTGEFAEAVDWFKTDFEDGANPMSRWCQVLGLVARGDIEGAKNNLDEWIRIASGPAPEDDYDRASQEVLKANLGAADYLQGVVQFAAGDFGGAAKALEKVAFDSGNGESALVLRHIALLRAGHATDGSEFKRSFQNVSIFPVVKFLTGEITEKEFVHPRGKLNDAAKERRYDCEANFYAGQKRLAAGDESAAMAFFEQAVAANFVEEEEFVLAKAALRRLREPAEGGD